MFFGKLPYTTNMSRLIMRAHVVVHPCAYFIRLTLFSRKIGVFKTALNMAHRFKIDKLEPSHQSGALPPKVKICIT